MQSIRSIEICSQHLQSKKSYYGNFFKNNLNDLKNTWKGIRNFLKIMN